MPDISGVDNEKLSNASKSISESLTTLGSQLSALPPELARQAVRMAFYFAGQPLTNAQIEDILNGVKWGVQEEEEEETSPKE